MKVLVFGATGMVGQGVLLACLDAGDVEQVTTVGRGATGIRHPKLAEIVRSDLYDLKPIEDQLADFDACYFCLGVSSIGMNEADYSRVTYDLTIAIAEVLARVSKRMTFVYVSGAGTDTSQRTKTMWARVKGRTENVLQRFPFKAVYLFRPGFILPVRGVHSKVKAYRLIYTVATPLVALIRLLRARTILTTEGVGIAMLQVTRNGFAKPIVEKDDIKAIVAKAPPY